MTSAGDRTEKPAGRDAGNWAGPVERLAVRNAPADAPAINVAGRRVTGPLQGFGQMWQKTYRARLPGAAVAPAEVIRTWTEHFPEFWPTGNRFYAPLTGIAPGEIGLFNLSLGPIRVSSGVLVLYADEVSFTLMTPEGHLCAGWITFSAHEEDGVTVVQAQVLIRANDPMYELGLLLGGHAQEDRLWAHTLRTLAARFGVDAAVEQDVVCVDRRRQWRMVGNIRHNAAMPTTLYRMATPVRGVRGLIRRAPADR